MSDKSGLSDSQDARLSAGGWPEAFRQRVCLLQRLLGLLFSFAGLVFIWLGVGPLVHRGSLGWLIGIGTFLLVAGLQALLLGPCYVGWLEQHRRAPS